MKRLTSNRMSGEKSLEIKEMFDLAKKPGMISFAGGFPAPELFPFERIVAVTEKAIMEHGKESLQYGITEGLMPLRKHIASYMTKFNINAKEEDIFILSGSQQGLEFSGKLFLNKGDIVFCESPTYIGAIDAFGSYECQFVEIESDADGMIPEDLEEKIIRSREGHFDTWIGGKVDVGQRGIAAYGEPKIIYVIPDFQNPSGRTWSLARRKAIYEIAARQNVIIVEDNPYGPLRFEGEDIPPIKSMDTDGRVIFLGTFSKTFAPGLRIGWVVASQEILSDFSILKQAADLQSSSLAQRQISLFLDEYDFKVHVAHLASVYKKRRDAMVRAIQTYFPSDVVYEIPKGGLFMWLALDSRINTKLLLRECIKQNVAFVPGEAFFPNGGGEHFMRLNYSNMNEEMIDKGIKCLGEIVENFYKAL